MFSTICLSEVIELIFKLDVKKFFSYIYLFVRSFKQT